MVRLRLPLLLLAIALAGCRPGADTMATTIRFDAFGDRVATTPVEARPTRLSLPSDFPSDVHLPAHYAIDNITEMPGTRIVNLLAEGQVVGLSRETRQAMEAAGWQRRLATQHAGDSAVLAFEKDGRSALFAFDRNRPVQASDDAGVIVSVQLQGGVASP